jgi:hypothetical protein
MGLDTFWAIFSQTHLVTLLATVSSRNVVVVSITMLRLLTVNTKFKTY